MSRADEKSCVLVSPHNSGQMRLVIVAVSLVATERTTFQPSKVSLLGFSVGKGTEPQ